jgi:hypothetical protein
VTYRIEEFVGRDATLAIPDWELMIPLADIYDQIELSC